jgi:hypothetical protein
MTDIREETNSEENVPAQVQQNNALPKGSAVLHIILRDNPSGDEADLVIEGVLCGTEIFDPTNPAHRFLAVIADRLPELMGEVGATQLTTDVAPPAGVAANDPTAGDDVAAG